MYNSDYHCNEYRVEFNVLKSSTDSFTSKNEWCNGFGKTREEAEHFAKKMICNTRNYIAKDDKNEPVGLDFNRIQVIGVTKV